MCSFAVFYTEDDSSSSLNTGSSMHRSVSEKSGSCGGAGAGSSSSSSRNRGPGLRRPSAPHMHSTPDVYTAAGGASPADRRAAGRRRTRRHAATLGGARQSRVHAVRGRAARRGHPADIPKAPDRETGARLAVVVVFAAPSAPPPAQRSHATASTAQPQPGVDRVVSQHRGQVRHRRVPLIVGARVVSAAVPPSPPKRIERHYDHGVGESIDYICAHHIAVFRFKERTTEPVYSNASRQKAAASLCGFFLFKILSDLSDL
ncbi:hypothetical protein AGLY_004804 [Aphis glycines]|uniref:Uncharacterized protein n=1 Tax=Aphis glycines TaxID=307491 RepID=A0A6G0TUZ8_APHGL|nr:hypothetical protein AGLY_004804 [Aphis glycines]